MDSGRGRGKRGQGRGAARGKPRGRGRGRGRKAARIVSSDEEASMDASEVQEESVELAVVEDAVIPVIPEILPSKIELKEETEFVETKHTIDMEADISQLEAPTFTTIQRNIPEPMLRLNWNHKVNLLGEKVMNPLIHICDQCNKPVLIYGRMIPCKHVFCFKCAKSELLKACPRCKDKVMRVEQTALGTVFMCAHGGPRHGTSGCRRTYLSQRDLNAHINHRHVNLSESKIGILENKASIAQPSPHQNSQHPQRKDSLSTSHSIQLQPSTPSNRHNVKHGSNVPPISVMQPSPRTNLINQAPQEQHPQNVQQNHHPGQGSYYNNNQPRQGAYNSGSFNGNQQSSQDTRQNAFYSSQSYNNSNNNNNNSGHYTQQQQPQQTQQNQQWNQQQSSGYYR